MGNHSLFLLLDNPPRLRIFDTRRWTVHNRIETTFYFSSDHKASPYFQLWLESHSFTPSMDELITAPFYPDPSQYALALNTGGPGGCYAVNTMLFLRLVRGREGKDVMWEEWAPCTFQISVDEDRIKFIRVSGCRLFLVETGEGNSAATFDDPDGHGRPRITDPVHLRIYDFSHAGRAKHLVHVADGTRIGVGPRQILPSSVSVLSWEHNEIRDTAVRCGSISFCIVSFSSPTGSQLNLGFGSGFLSRMTHSTKSQIPLAL